MLIRPGSVTTRQSIERHPAGSGCMRKQLSKANKNIMASLNLKKHYQEAHKYINYGDGRHRSAGHDPHPADT